MTPRRTATAALMMVYGRITCAILPCCPDRLAALPHPKHVAARGRIKRAWLAFFGPYCLFCGERMNTRDCNNPRYATIDHIDCRALGGSDTWNNAQVICLACNREKGMAEKAAVERGRGIDREFAKVAGAL